MTDDPRFPNTLSRRALIQAAASAGAAAALGVGSAPAWSGSAGAPAGDPGAAAGSARSYPPDWTGRNINLHQYRIVPGYPPYEPHPRYLGELAGTWHQIGEQYGERAADLIRWVYEGWYRELLPVQGSPAVMAAYLRQQEAYYDLLVPEALELMHGIAEGAAAELVRSAFARELSHFDKIMMINSYFGLKGAPPAMAVAQVTADCGVHSCSGAVVLGSATRDGKTIHVSSEDQHFFPQEYLVSFIVRPSDPRAHRYTVTDSAGEIGSEHAQNDRGVTVSGYAGGGIGILGPTLSHPFSGYRRPGLDWQVGNFYAAAFADSARHAVELLTVGRPEYRARSGRRIVIGKCTRGANWVVSDRDEAFVVESIPADQRGIARYAIRVPGQMGEKGGHYIASTNNVEAPDSYNEDNIHDPAHPMRQHGNAEQNPAYFGLNLMGMRFWTFMWLIRNEYGRVDVQMVQAWRRAHFTYDQSGVRHTHATVQGKSVPVHLLPGAATLCWHSSGPAGVDTFEGVDTYVSLSVAQDLVSFRTKGRPCEWSGPWDRLSLG